MLSTNLCGLCKGYLTTGNAERKYVITLKTAHNCLELLSQLSCYILDICCERNIALYIPVRKVEPVLHLGLLWFCRCGFRADGQVQFFIKRIKRCLRYINTSARKRCIGDYAQKSGSGIFPSFHKQETLSR